SGDRCGCGGVYPRYAPEFLKVAVSELECESALADADKPPNGQGTWSPVVRRFPKVIVESTKLAGTTAEAAVARWEVTDQWISGRSGREQGCILPKHTNVHRAQARSWLLAELVVEDSTQLFI